MCASSINDNILDNLNNGQIDFIPKNPYLRKAQKMTGILYSINQFMKEFENIFVDNSLPLVIEIGSYMGETLIDLAQNNPKVNFIGVDIVFKRVVKTSEKIKKCGLENVKMLLGDGLKLVESLSRNSIHGLCVFFPDPWEKKKRKRLVNGAFLKRVKIILNKKGFLWIKTDHQDYYNSFKELIIETGFLQDDNIPELLLPKVYPTFFESLFENQNKVIYENILTCK